MSEKSGQHQGRYLSLKVGEVGFVDKTEVEGMVVLVSEDGRKFPIRAFSGEVARHIARFKSGDRSSIPTIYNMIEELADFQSLFLTEVEIYERETILRANLFFVNRTSSIAMKNYRASDSIALATFYDVPIKMKRELFEMLSMK